MEKTPLKKSAGVLCLALSTLASSAVLAPDANAGLTSGQVNAAYNDLYQYVQGGGRAGGKRPVYREVSDNGTVRYNATVSEGVAYMMTLAACNNDRSNFDAFRQYWRFYTANNSAYPWLMPWIINSDGYDIANGVPAPDADLDIAYALLVADRNWGSTNNKNYLQEAKNVIAGIKRDLIAPNARLIKAWPASGDTQTWSTYITSYHMPAYYKVFGEVTNDTGFWNDVRNKTYTWIQQHTNSSTGLNHFMQSYQGVPRNNREFDADACRLPWRIAQDYLWTNDSRARAHIEKVANWAQGAHGGNVSDIRYGYLTNGGNNSGWNGSALFASVFAVTTQARYGTNNWVNRCWDDITGRRSGVTDFYQNAVKTMCMFAADGRFILPNGSGGSGGGGGGGNGGGGGGGNSGPLVDGATYRLKLRWGGNYLNQNADSQNAPVSVAPLNTGWGSMKWRAERVSGNVYRFRCDWGGRYLNATSNQPWTEVQVHTKQDGWGSMKWTVESVSGNIYRLKCGWGGNYLAGSNEAWALTQTQTFNADWWSQQWILERL